MTPNCLSSTATPNPTALPCPGPGVCPQRRGEGGAEVTLHHVGELPFEPDLHHGYDEAQPLEPDLLALQQSLEAGPASGDRGPSGGATCRPGSRLAGQNAASVPAFRYQGRARCTRSACWRARRRACCSPWTALSGTTPLVAGLPSRAHLLAKPVLGLCGIQPTHRQHLGPVHTSRAGGQRWFILCRGRGSPGCA